MSKSMFTYICKNIKNKKYSIFSLNLYPAKQLHAILISINRAT